MSIYGLADTRETGLLERVQKMPIKVHKGSRASEERLRELTLFRLQKRRPRKDFYQFIWKEGAKKLEADPFQWFPVTGQKATDSTE